jgi:hypothetical protein
MQKRMNLVLGVGAGNHVDAAASLVEEDLPIGEREEGPIAASADVLARDEFRTALTDDDAAGGDELAAKFLDAKPFADAVAAVANAALTFLVSHKIKL